MTSAMECGCAVGASAVHAPPHALLSTNWRAEWQQRWVADKMHEPMLNSNLLESPFFHFAEGVFCVLLLGAG